MKISYKAFEQSGKAASGTIEAATVAEAREQIRKQGLFVTDICEMDGAGAATGSGKKGRVSNGQRLRNLATFARQLHVLVSSGTQIVQAMSAIERQCEHESWRLVLAELRRRVEEGAPLSEAMRHQPGHFDAVCRSLVAAGESSGNLPVMLDRLASLTRKQLHMRSSIVGALIYPCLLVGIGLIVLVVMLLFVLPRFTTLFDSLDSPLPPTTKVLMWLSAMLWQWWWAMILGTGALVVAGKYWINSEGGKRTIHTWALRVPKVGRLARSMMSARLARMLGTLLESRVALMDALQLTRQAVNNVHYAALLTRAEEAVTRGEPISAVLGNSELLASCVQEALRNGEASGQIGQPLLHMAEFLDEENDVVIKSLTSIIEPAILIFLGLIVGFIALSMFLPLFDLVSAAHGGG